mmetsp:Transcript_30012/g.30511  ORF Transcript_30012/g.30511 Transcript_30012/m.30511 type:complete len:280 (+) Transcript_30012:120-959(+)
MNMNMNMNAASTTTTNENSPSNNPNPMYHNFPSSSPLLVPSSMDFQQHLHQLQQQQQMKHELDQLQKRQQELVQMISTNTTTMIQKYNNPYSPMSMPMSQIQQEKKKEQQQQQLQSSTAIASATITPPITKKKTVNLGKTHFIIDLTEEADPTHTTVDTNNTAPSELDILLGRGKGVENHQGNICYRKVVESFRTQYEAIQHKRDKTKFIRDVVDIFYDTGHQFVKKMKDPDPNGCVTSVGTCAWVPVDRHVARDKVSHSFRNAKRLQTASVSASTNNK